MAINKTYVDSMVTGVTWVSGRSANPVIGECYFDVNNAAQYMWNGHQWMMVSQAPFLSADIEPPVNVIPTEAELEKYPALKESWEAYLIVKKLIGKK